MTRYSKTTALRLINELAVAEFNYSNSLIVAASVPGGIIQVRIGGVVCRIKTLPVEFAGIGVFEPISMTEALLVRVATLSERKNYFANFPIVRLIVCEKTKLGWSALNANHGDNRFRIDGIVPVCLANEVQVFDVVKCRFDGRQYWYDEHDSNSNPKYAQVLRESITKSVRPEDVLLPGLSGEHRAAYELSLWRKMNPTRKLNPMGKPFRWQENSKEDERVEDVLWDKISNSLSHGGAQLIDFVERRDAIQVNFRLGGRKYSSAVDKNRLTVLSSGICLDGRDQDFDLNSLVGVFREGHELGEI